MNSKFADFKAMTNDGKVQKMMKCLNIQEDRQFNEQDNPIKCRYFHEIEI